VDVRIVSDVPCESLRGVAITVGPTPLSAETARPARRRLNYLEHESLVVPITLRGRCRGIGCSATTTCVKTTECASSDVSSNCMSECRLDPDDGSVDEPSDLPDASNDGAAEGASDGGTGDDRSMPADSGDGGGDDGGNPGTVCGDLPNPMCGVDVCCAMAQTSTTADCRTPFECNEGGWFTIGCKGTASCGPGSTCCIDDVSRQSQCGTTCSGNVACLNDMDCVPFAMFCIGRRWALKYCQ
jgi:hypothetical protein